MPDTKITALTAIGANPIIPATFPIPMVDLTDTSMAASGTTKKVTVNQILGAGGTATLASATITGAATVGTTLGVTGVSTLASAVVTGDLTVDTSTLKVDSANNYVGIGTTSPAQKLHADNQANSCFIRATSTQNSAGFDFGVGGTGDATAYINNRNNTPIAFAINNTEAMRLNTTGNLAFVTGKGIDFSATTEGSGTMTSELLNDYEEGTFTPTVIGATTAGVGVYTTQVGRYTKIGNLVTVQVYLGWSAHTGTGNMRFGNFPFNTSSDSGSNNGVSFGYVNNIALSASNVLTGLTGIGNSYVDAYQYPVGGGASTAVPIDTAGDVIFTASYRV